MAKHKTTTGALPSSAGFPGGKLAMSSPTHCRPGPDWWFTHGHKQIPIKRVPIPELTRGQIRELLTTGKLVGLVGVDEIKTKKKKK